MAAHSNTGVPDAVARRDHGWFGTTAWRGERTRASACGQEPEAESTGTQAASGTLSTIQATITRRAGATASATERIRIAARRPERTTAPTRTKHCAISPPISAPGCGDFISAGKIFPQRGAGVLRNDCAASKTYLRWNVNAPWTRCRSGVDSIRTNAKLFWTSSNACHAQTDFFVTCDGRNER